MSTEQSIIQENEKRHPRFLDEPSGKAERNLRYISLDYPRHECFMETHYECITSCISIDFVLNGRKVIM